MLRRARELLPNFLRGTPPDRKWRDLPQDTLDKRDLAYTPIKIRPKDENPGLEHGPAFMKALHGFSTGKYQFQNTSDESSFEFWYHNGDLDLVFIPGGPSSRDRFIDGLASLYPETQLREANTDWPTPAMGHSVAVADTSLTDHFYLPIARVHDVMNDPLDNITNAISVTQLEGEGDSVYPGNEARFTLQVMMKPASEAWCSKIPFGVDCESRADLIASGKYKGGILRRLGDSSNHIEASEDDLQTARVLNQQYESPGYYARIRLFAAAPDQQATINYMDRVINALGSLSSPFSGQEIAVSTQTSAPEDLLGRMRDRDMNLSLRDRLGENKMMFSFDELASLVHLPTEGTSAPIDWTTMDHGAGVPDEMPAFKDVVENTDFTEQDHKRLEKIGGDNDR